MAEAGRVGDESRVDADSHGCPACPHTASGAATSGSADVIINNRSALRVGDRGVHASCCGPNSWRAAAGAASVLFNDRPAHRKGDAVSHCGGMGVLIGGSSDVLIGSAGSPMFGGGLLALMLPDAAVHKALDHDDIASSLSHVRQGLGISQATLSRALTLLCLALHIDMIVDMLTFLVDLVFRIATGLLKVVLWPLRQLIPYFDEFLRNLLTYLKMLSLSLVNMFDLDGNECPQLSAASTPGDDDEFTFTDDANGIWNGIGNGSDVSPLVYRLLFRFRPIFIELSDDILPISMGDLLKFAHLDPPPAGSPDGRFPSLESYAASIENYSHGDLAIDEGLARGHVRTGSRTYHARATRTGEHKISLLYFALRPGSFFSNKYLDRDLFEHQGDGEGVMLFVERNSAADPWRLMGASFDATHYKRDCLSASPPPRGVAHQVPMEMRDSRPLIYVAIGSHAMCPRGGKRQIMGGGGIKGWFQKIGIDFYPSATATNTFADYELVISCDPYVGTALFTKDKKIRWGKGSYVWGADPYDGYSWQPIPDSIQSYDARADENSFWKASPTS